MKSLTSLLNYLLLCSLLILFSCTKNNADLNTALAQNGANDRLLSNADALGTMTFAPGDSLVVKGDTSNGDVTVLLQTYAPDANRINFLSFIALTPPYSGNGGIDRSIIKFQLRNITDSIRNNPPHIQKAILHLYQYKRPAELDPYASPHFGDNSVELHRVAGDWQSNTVTWNNQPVFAKGSANPLEDVVIIPPVATPLLRHTNDNQAIDVTDMINKIITTRNNNGFMLKLTKQGERAGNIGRSYGAFACPDPTKRPTLVLYF